MRILNIIGVILILAGASWLTTLVDDGLGIVWTHNVVRNWEQCGFFNLHGKLVYNPGGYQADTQPQTYPGHHAVGLYPFFIFQNLFHRAGARIYYATAAGAVLLSIWLLLGRTNEAFWLGGLAVLTPGYLRWQPSLDPNLASVLAGFPFCVAMIYLLRRERLSFVQIGLALGLIILYSTINWSTVFIQAMLFATLLFLPGVSRKNLVTYVVLVALPSVIVVTTSVIDKMTNGHQTSGGGIGKILGDYGWGNYGYGLDLGTRTALARLAFVNFIGLLPVIIYIGVELWRGRALGAKGAGSFFLLPFFAAMGSVGVLRNYFGHHPWMSCNFILLGMILSLVVWKSTHNAPDARKLQIKPALPWAMFAGAFAYGFIVLLFYHIHNEQELDLVQLVRNNTVRADKIVITRDSDPRLADIEDRLSELFDRNMVVLDTISDSSTGMTNEIWLTAVPAKQAGYQLVAGNGGTAGNKNTAIIKQMLGWYSRVIAHRRAGDKLEVAAQYYLYR